MNKMLRITVLVFASLSIECAVCQNAKLTRRGLQIRCDYSGDGNVTGVEIGCSSAPLVYEKNGSNWTLFVEGMLPFDKGLIQNVSFELNSCTFELNPMLLLVNVTICCTFLDPDRGQPKASLPVNSKDVPDVPYNVTITDVKQTSLTIKWVAGYNGGLEQTFHIMIIAGNISRSVYVPDPGYRKYGTQTIEDLMPNTKYGIQMSANNSMGSSNLTNVIFQNTLKGNLIDGVGGGGGLSLSAIVGITVVFIFLVAAAAIICACCKCKANTGKETVSEPNYIYHVAKGEADQESLKPECEEYEDLHKGEK